MAEEQQQEQPKQIELHRFRVYPEDTKQPVLANNAVIEMDGVKLKGVTEFIYRIGAQGVPQVNITMIANTQLDIHGQPEIRQLDVSKDSVEM